MVILCSSVLMSSSKRYLVACSAGPDSMALLDIYRRKYEVKVCHINYHHRDTADRDENIIRKYCDKHGLELFVYDYKESKGNFQEAARNFRYDCFSKLVDEYKLDGVLVAHHKDDLIETYLMQRERGSVSFYGLKEENTVRGVRVIRPLLNMSKAELIEYDREHDIEYGIDESNLGNDYKRNRIRHSTVEKMSAEKKNEIIGEINRLNNELRIKEEAVNSFINGKDRFAADEFLGCRYVKDVLRKLLYVDLSEAYLDEILKALLRNGVEIKVHSKFISRVYDSIEVYPERQDYAYVLSEVEYKDFGEFVLMESGDDFHGVTLSADDFPITIRNYHEGDFIKMRYGTKKLNRYFIDHKISYRERRRYPVMVNRNNEVVLVPGIGSNVNHYSKHHSVYMLK